MKKLETKRAVYGPMAGHIWLRLGPRVPGFSACGHKQACTLLEMKYYVRRPIRK